MLFELLKQAKATFTTFRFFKDTAALKMPKRKKFPLSIPSTITIEVFSNGTLYLAPALILRTELKAYLFNCPEGLSRFIPAMRVRPNQLQDVFITRDIWENVSGLFGLTMGKDEISDEDFRIHGPPKICYFMQYLKSASDEFGKFPVNIKEFDNKCDHYEDSAIYVDYLQISNKLDKQYTQNNNNSKCSSESITNVAYLIELKKRPPHIDPLKLIQLKLPRTSVIERLKQGETVTLDDGRVIRPDDIIDRAKTDHEFPNLLIVDIQTEENLESIVGNPILNDYYGENRLKQMNYIVHFGPNKIFELGKYNEWLRLFGPKCTHLVLNGMGKSMPVTDRIQNAQNLLRQIFPQGFPELYSGQKFDEGKEITQDDEEFDVNIPSDGNVGPIIYPGQGRRFSLRGLLNKNINSMDQIKMEFIPGEKILAKKMEELPEELDRKIKEFKEVSFDLLNEGGGEEGNEYPIVTFLGTGSAVPNIYRNVSANLLQTNEKSNFLIDCGEGTYGQMNALFGPEETEKELTKLNAIFITHHHVDHFLGFFKILQKRKEAFEKLELRYKQLIVVCNTNFINLCDKFSREFADLRPYIFFMNWIKLITQNSDEKLIEQKRGYANLEEKMKGGIFALDEWNIRQIRAIQVIHKKWSCGFSFQTELENRKIVFSGDTQPSENLEWWGKDADLLIHECTLEDGMEIDANKKRHSTMRQAFDSANKMRAKNVILTHFSMRYSQVPPLPEYLIEAGNFSCAKDNMVVPFKLLPLFHKLLPVYQSLYIDELHEISRKKLNRIFDENKKKKEEENEMNENERIKMIEN